MQPETHKSLFPRLHEALDAIDGGRYVFADQAHVEKDIDELGLDGLDDYLNLIYECLQLAQQDPVNCHRPPRETHSSRHSASAGLRLWPFVVTHPVLGKEIYFKFCLRPDENGSYYVHIDCHEDRN